MLLAVAATGTAGPSANLNFQYQFAAKLKHAGADADYLFG